MKIVHIVVAVMDFPDNRDIMVATMPFLKWKSYEIAKWLVRSQQCSCLLLKKNGLVYVLDVMN